MLKKIKIKIGIIGYIPFEFNKNKIKKWKSDIFEIVDNFDEFHFQYNADTSSWGYSDELLNREIPKNEEGDFFIYITYVPIENNYYARRLEGKRIVLSYFEMYDILKKEHIPMENLLLRVLYAYSLVFLRNSKHIPEQSHISDFTHDDTRGCLFDMNGNKTDVIFSLNVPRICDDCKSKIRHEKVSDNIINQISKELKRIKKKKFYKISDFVKKRPLISIMISSIFGIVLSIIANIIYEKIFK